MSFARGDGLLARLRVLRNRIGMERLLARVIEAAEVAGLPHAQREFGGRARGIAHLLRIVRGLLGRDGLDVRAACVGCDLQHRVGGFELGLLETAAFDVRRERHRQQREHVRRERAAERQLAVAGTGAAEREARVRQPAGLDEVCFRQPQFCIRSLQPAVVQQRDLHRASSIDSGFASSSFVRLSTASRSASVLTTTASFPMRADAADDTASKPPSFENVVQPARKASTAAAAPILGDIAASSLRGASVLRMRGAVPRRLSHGLAAAPSRRGSVVSSRGLRRPDTAGSRRMRTSR